MTECGADAAAKRNKKRVNHELLIARPAGAEKTARPIARQDCIALHSNTVTGGK